MEKLIILDGREFVIFIKFYKEKDSQKHLDCLMQKQKAKMFVCDFQTLIYRI